MNLSVRVYYEDTDSGGVVYHAAYLRFMERLRSEWLWQRLPANSPDYAFVVRRAGLEFHAAARLGEELVVNIDAVRHSGARLVFAQSVRDRGAGMLYCDAIIECACVSPSSGKARRIPSVLVESL